MKKRWELKVIPPYKIVVVRTYILKFLTHWPPRDPAQGPVLAKLVSNVPMFDHPSKVWPECLWRTNYPPIHDCVFLLEVKIACAAVVILSFEIFWWQYIQVCMKIAPYFKPYITFIVSISALRCHSTLNSPISGTTRSWPFNCAATKAGRYLGLFENNFLKQHVFL